MAGPSNPFLWSWRSAKFRALVYQIIAVLLVVAALAGVGCCFRAQGDPFTWLLLGALPFVLRLLIAPAFRARVFYWLARQWQAAEAFAAKLGFKAYRTCWGRGIVLRAVEGRLSHEA